MWTSTDLGRGLSLSQQDCVVVTACILKTRSWVSPSPPHNPQGVQEEANSVGLSIVELGDVISSSSGHTSASSDQAGVVKKSKYSHSSMSRGRV